MFKKMMDLKYDMEDYICEYKYKTETNQEYLDNVKKSIEEYDREHEILKKLIPFYYISSDIVDNLHNTIVNDSPIKVKKVKKVKKLKRLKNLNVIFVIEGSLICVHYYNIKTTNILIYKSYGIFHNKYIPESLDDFKFSYFSVNLLKNLVKKPSNMPNLILSGMKTYDLILFVRALLNDMYGKDNLVYKKINLNCDGSEVAIKTSQYHYEFDMNFYKFTRRDLVLKFIDTVSKTINVSNQSYNIVVIKDAHLITHKVQAALRRTMELYVKSVRFIFLSKSCNNLVEAVQSRCSNILITGPNLKQSIKILLNISKLENIEIDTKT